MAETRVHHAVAAARRSSPRAVRDLANLSTRAYGMATARWRPLPDFLVVGTKRGGTTSLWNYLVAHPQVCGLFPSPRERKSTAYFFEHLDRSPRWYRSHFHTDVHRRRRARRHGAVAVGEASPYYMYGLHTPRLIAEMMPTVRLVMMLRDPVARAYGHYQERVKEGVETLSFEEALDAEGSRLAGEYERMQADPTYYSRAHDFFSYRDRGVYLPQVRRVLDVFPRSQVLILSSDDFYDDEQPVFDQVCDFLGIDAVRLERPERHNFIPRASMAASTAEELREFYAPHNRALYDELGRDFGWEAART